MQIRHFVIAAIALVTSASASAQSALIVKLSPAEQTINQGVAPEFVVTVRAMGNGLRIFNFAAPEGPNTDFVRVIVERNGKSIHVPIMISDPGPISSSDYVNLPPGQELRFKHNGAPFVLAALTPGEYSAVVELEPHPNSTWYWSNVVSFHVIGP